MSSYKIPLLITSAAIAADPALQSGSRGARKIVVTSLYEEKEIPFENSHWQGSPVKSPVMVLDNTEFAVFTDETVQDRHYHKHAHEFYTVLNGKFVIEVEGEMFSLTSGETIIVPPYAVHEVFRDHRFTAQVVTTNCGGVSDKFLPEDEQTQ